MTSRLACTARRRILGEAQGRAETAEGRAADLAAELRAARLDVGQLRDDLDAVGQEANAYRGEIESLRAKLSREQEERETLRQRVIEFARVSEERDAALLREELIEAELGAVRGELAEAKLVADPLNAGTREREARLGGAERLRAELVAAHESAVRVTEQLRLAVQSVTDTLTDPHVTTSARSEEDDEPTQIFGDSDEGDRPQAELTG